MVKRLVGKGRPRSTRYYRWWWWYLQKKRKGRGGPSDIPIWDDLPNLDELIFASSGDVSEDGTWLYGGPGYHCENGRMKGSAAAGNGTMYGQIDGLLTSHTFTVGDGSGTPTCTTNGRLDIANGVYVWDLKVWDGETLIADLPMICLGSGTEFSSIAGLPDCVWNPPVAVQLPSHPGVPTQHEVDPGAFYEVFTDGTGSNRANVDGFSIVTPELPELPYVVPAAYVEAGLELTNGDYYKGGYGTLVDNTVTSDGTGWGAYLAEDVVTRPGATYDVIATSTSNSDNCKLYVWDRPDANALVNIPDIGGSDVVTTASFVATTATSSIGLQIAPNDGDFVTGTFSVKAQAGDYQPQCLGPIAADMLLGGIGIQGDDNRYVVTDAPSDPSAIDTITASYIHGPKPAYTRFIVGAKATSDRFYIGVDDLNLVRIALGDTTIVGTVDNIELVQGEHYLISLWAKDGSYSLTVNGVEDSSGTYLGQAGTSLYGLSLMSLQNSANNTAPTQGVVLSVETRLNGNLVNHWHCEDGQPGQAVAKVEDVKGGNHGEIIEPVAAQLPATPENPYPIQRALETAWVQTTVGPCYRMVGGFNLDKEGPELWTSPTTQTINASNYSTYDADTGIGRIISDGTSVQLSAIGAAVDGGSYDLIYTELNRIGGNLKVGSASEYTSLANGSESPEYTQAGTTITIARDSACDVTFKLSVKQKTLGYSCEDMNNPGYDVDGDPIQWKANQYETFLNAGILVQGSLGPETQALTTWKDGAWVDISTLPFNIDDQEFYCDKGFALYNTPQDAESIDSITEVICKD